MKSAERTLTAKIAIKILLCTATDLEKTPGHKTKSVDECLTLGPAKPQTNGWEPSAVYGHGLVNLSAALQPLGGVSPAGTSGQPLAAVNALHTRLSFSTAFGDISARTEPAFGAVDMFNRAYRLKVPIFSISPTSPKIGYLMQFEQSLKPLAQITFSANNSRSVRWSYSPESSIGAGRSFTFTGPKYQSQFTVTREQRSHESAPLNGLLANTSPAHQMIWPKITSRGIDLIRADIAIPLDDRVMLGIHSSTGLLSWANNHTNAYRFIDNAASLIAHYDPLTTGIRVGQFSEDNHFLGSRADGGYILKKPSQSNYIHASITSRYANWTAAASATALRTRTYFNYSHFVDDMTLKSNSYHFSLSRGDAMLAGDKLSVSYQMPLAVTKGQMTQHSIKGYTSSDRHRNIDDTFDFAVKSRHQTLQLDYHAALNQHATIFASASRHRNWDNQEGQKNTMLFTGLNVTF